MRKLIRCFGGIGIILGWVYPAWPFSITSPEEGTVFHPGEKVTIIAEAAPGESIHTVDFNPTISMFNFVEGPPFQFQFVVPPEFIGKLTLYAKGISGVRPAFKFFEAAPVEILVALPSSVRLQSLRVDRDQKSLFMRPGSVDGLNVYGGYSDGVERRIENSSDTTYQTSNPKIVSVDSGGLVSAIAPGKAVITIRNGDKKLQIEVNVKLK